MWPQCAPLSPDGDVSPMNDEPRQPRRGRPRRRPDGGGGPRRHGGPRGNFQRRRDSGPRCTSVYAGGYPQGHDEARPDPVRAPGEDDRRAARPRDRLRHRGRWPGAFRPGPEAARCGAVGPGVAARGDRRGRVSGILEIVDEGFAFLRRRGVMPSPDDIYVSSSIVRRFGLRTGDRVVGQAGPRRTRSGTGASPGSTP